MEIITAHSFRGGTGKTNIVANLSYVLAKAGYRVGVVDADTSHPSLHVIYGLGGKQPHPTLAEYLLGQCDLNEIVHDISTKVGLKDCLYIIPSNLNEEKITEIVKHDFDFGRLYRGLREIGNNNDLDFLLLDTKPELDEKIMLFFTITNLLLVVTRFDEADIRGTKELLKIVNYFKVPSIYVVPNMIEGDQKSKIMIEIEKQFESFKGLGVSVSNPIIFSSKLSVDHSPRIDELFITKYSDDAFSQSVSKLKDIII